jgi:PAS domain S-box-containing protein
MYKPHLTAAEMSDESEIKPDSSSDLPVDAFLMLDENLNLLNINDAGQSMFGVSGVDAFGKCIVDIMPDIKQSGIYKKCRNVLRTDESIVVYQKLGDRSLVVKVFKLGNGLGLIASDITERRKAEEELKKFKTISDRACYGIGIIDLAGNLTYVNESFAQMHGYSVEELGYKHFSILHTREQMKDVERLVKRLKQTGCFIAEEVWHKKRGGMVFPTLMNGTAIEDNKGKPAYLSATAVDITERKKGGEALRESEEKYRNLFNNAQVGLFRSRVADGKIIECNDLLARMFGYQNREECIARHVTSEHYVDPNVRALELAQMLAKGKVENLEALVTRKDGSPFWISYSATIYPERDCIEGVVIDITERKQAEEALKESEKQYSALVGNLTDAVFLFKDGLITWCNDRIEEIYGYPKEELLGKHASFFYPSDMNPSEFARKISVALKERGLFRDTTKFQRKDGSIIDLEYSLSQTPGKDPIQLIAVARDITERKKAEEELKESEERFRTLVETAGQAGEGRVIVQNTEEREAAIVFVNDGFTKILGYSREEALKVSAWDLLSPDALVALQGWFERRLKGENMPSHYEITVLRKDGTKVPLEISMGTVLYKGKKATVYYFRDITERKRVEEERECLLNELAEKTKQLEQIVYVTSHDLRSPLVNIQGFTRELDESFKQVYEIFDSKAVPSAVRKKLAPLLDEDIPHALQYILASSSKMNSLLSGLLRLSRLGRAALKIKRLGMNKLMAEVVASFEFQVKESGVKIRVEELPPCYGDETQINQVLSNLLDNALKFLDPDRPGRIRISGKAEKGRVTYCVEDNGIGIADKDREQIFEIFCRLDPDAGIGEGLGLTIVRKILDRHSGKVWVESEPGKGSRFFVSLQTKEGINDKK